MDKFEFEKNFDELINDKARNRKKYESKIKHSSKKHDSKSEYKSKKKSNRLKFEDDDY